MLPKLVKLRDEQVEAFYQENQDYIESFWNDKIEHIRCNDSIEHLNYVVNSDACFWEFVEDLYDIKHGA